MKKGVIRELFVPLELEIPFPKLLVRHSNEVEFGCVISFFPLLCSHGMPAEW